MERPGRSGGGMAIPARHERLINTVAPKSHFQAERLVFIFLRFQVLSNITAQLAVENVAHNYLTALVNLITRPQFSLTLNIQSGSALARRSALRRVLPLR